MLSYPDETLQAAEEDSQTTLPKGYPSLPTQLEDTGLPDVLIEDLLLKNLLAKGTLTGREMAETICLPFKIVHPILTNLKNKMMLTHRTTASLGDFYYVLTEQGKQQAVLSKEYCAYSGAAPVVFKDYIDSVHSQSIRHELPRVEDLKRAFSDIVTPEGVLETLGPAINSGRGLFLFGEPGNGKTTLAERIRDCFSEGIYIPRAVWVDGEIVQLFDPQSHEVLDEDQGEKFDTRWVKIKRPLVVVGGELTMDSLEIKYDPVYRVSEAPLQMKANGGTFLIDDFGRQRIDHRDLLNRWIVPLEKRYDFLILPNGKKIQVPFDQLIIFSTNLNPKELVDDAFLRRIPYKIEVHSPDEMQFRKLFQFQCARVGIAYDDTMVSYLINQHYQGVRGFRACHARDILDQVINASAYFGVKPTLSQQLLDLACKNYFSAMACSSDNT